MPPGWLRSEAEVEERVNADKQQQQTAALLEQMKAGSEVAKNIGNTAIPSGTLGGAGTSL
jgi:hypothetical protein